MHPNLSVVTGGFRRWDPNVSKNVTQSEFCFKLKLDTAKLVRVVTRNKE